jgi:hypothetical protein
MWTDEECIALRSAVRVIRETDPVHAEQMIRDAFTAGYRPGFQPIACLEFPGSLLWEVTFWASADCVAFMIEAGEDALVAPWPNYWNCFHIAAIMGRKDTLAILENKCGQAALNMKTRTGYTPLMCAIKFGPDTPEVHTTIRWLMQHPAVDLHIPIGLFAIEVNDDDDNGFVGYIEGPAASLINFARYHKPNLTWHTHNKTL